MHRPIGILGRRPARGGTGVEKMPKPSRVRLRVLSYSCSLRDGLDDLLYHVNLLINRAG